MPAHETFYDVMRRHGITRRSFLKFCSLTAAGLGLASRLEGAPAILQGKARPGPTWDEVVLIHAVSRIAFDGLIDNIQVYNDGKTHAKRGLVFANDGHGHFTEVGVDAGVAFNSIGEAPGSMNAAIGDANGDAPVSVSLVGQLFSVDGADLSQTAAPVEVIPLEDGPTLVYAETVDPTSVDFVDGSEMVLRAVCAGGIVAIIVKASAGAVA